MWRYLILVAMTVMAFGVMTVAFAEKATEPSFPPTASGRLSGSEAAVVIVEPGDHLWKITARFLGERLGKTAPDEMVAQLWREVISVNVDSLRSGDPDLIYPGESIRIPDR